MICWVILFEFQSGTPLAALNNEKQALALVELINRGRRGTEAPEAVVVAVPVLDPRLPVND